MPTTGSAARLVAGTLGSAAVLPGQCSGKESGALSAGPRGPTGPDIPLSDAEKRQLATPTVVTGYTDEAVQAACECAVKEGAGVVFLPSGEYAFAREVHVPGGLTLQGEGATSVCLAKGKDVCLFQVGGESVRFTRLKLLGADIRRSADHDSYGISVNGCKNIRIDHCELLGFSRATNFVDQATGQVDHCGIHHNLRDGQGYGVLAMSGAHVLVTDNEFSQNRHSLASNGTLDWEGRDRTGTLVHLSTTRKTHWEFIHNRVGSNDLAQREFCAVDAHPGMDGTFVVENNIFENLCHGVGIRDGSGSIRDNVFRNLRTVTDSHPVAAISITYDTHNGLPVEGCMPHDIDVVDNVFRTEGTVYEEYSLGKAENITINDRLVPDTKVHRPSPQPSPLLIAMDQEGRLGVGRR